MLEKEFNWYLENQKELVKKYSGKVLAIKDEAVIGVFGNTLEAYVEVSKTHQPGTFLLQECTPGEDAYTQNFITRAIF